LLLAGVPIEDVSILLGHASVRITERAYAPWIQARRTPMKKWGLTVAIVALFAAATVRWFTMPVSRQIESIQAARVNVIVPITNGQDLKMGSDELSVRFSS
jgi:hypothetical protein